MNTTLRSNGCARFPRLNRTPAYLARVACPGRSQSARRIFRCSSSPEETPDPLEGISEEVEKLLEEDPEARAKIENVTKAAQKVAELQAKKKELEDKMTSLQSRSEIAEKRAQAEADDMVAQAEVKASEKMYEVAQLQMKKAQIEQQMLMDEMTQNEDRIDSAKAAVVGVLGGGLALAPILYASDNAVITSTLSLVFGVVSCALFGITYRYALRRDLDNTQLRGGVIAAFGLVRGLGGADTLQNWNYDQGLGPFDLDVIGPAALFTGQSMLVFAFSAFAVETGFKLGWLKPFGEEQAGEGGSKSGNGS